MFALKLILVCALIPLGASKDEQFVGKWELSSSENFDEFLTELGVGWFWRSFAKRATPIVTISKDGDEYTMTTETTFKTSTLKFKLGQEFEEERMDGTEFKSKITAEGNKLIQLQYGDECKEATITREFDDKVMKTIATTNKVTSTRIYKSL